MVAATGGVAFLSFNFSVIFRRFNLFICFVNITIQLQKAIALSIALNFSYFFSIPIYAVINAVASMFSKICNILIVGSACVASAALAQDLAPKSVLGHRMIMSYYHATGQLKKKVGDTYYSDLGKGVFFSAKLNGSKPHKGVYAYHKIDKNDGEITVEHPHGRFKGWTYSMKLHFNSAHIGTFAIVDHGRVNGTMSGVFELS